MIRRSAALILALIPLNACDPGPNGLQRTPLRDLLRPVETIDFSLASEPGRIRSILFSPVGSHALTLSHDDKVRLWNLRQGRRVAVLLDSFANIFLASFSPDGAYVSLLLSEALPRSVGLWRTEDGSRVATIDEKRGGYSAQSLTFSPDSRRFLLQWQTPFEDCELWDTRSGTRIAELTGRVHSEGLASFSPNGSWVLTVQQQYEHICSHICDPVKEGCHTLYSLWLWRAADGRSVSKLGEWHRPIQRTIFSPDSTELLVVSQEWAGRWRIQPDTGGAQESERLSRCDAHRSGAKPEGQRPKPCVRITDGSFEILR